MPETSKRDSQCNNVRTAISFRSENATYRLLGAGLSLLYEKLCAISSTSLKPNPPRRKPITRLMCLTAESVWNGYTVIWVSRPVKIDDDRFCRGSDEDSMNARPIGIPSGQAHLELL